MKYKSINDAAKNAKVDPAYRPRFAPGPVRVWYARDWGGQFQSVDLLKRSGIPLPTPNDIWTTHTRLGSIHGHAGLHDATGMEAIYFAMQGENWSPEGEANDLIRSQGLRHTSMSMGDIIQPPDGTLWYVDTTGFTKIWPKDNPSLRRGRRPKRKNPSDLRSIMRKYG